MTITISPQTQKLLEDVMKMNDYASPDEAIRTALQALEGDAIDSLDLATQQAIDRADEQGDHGEGIPADQAFDQLRRKHL